MGVVRDKMIALDKHINAINKLQDLWCNRDTDYEAMAKEAEEIVKLASFLASYKELDKEREKHVKEAAMVYMNENNTYDGVFLDCLGYCFGEYD